MNIVCKRCGEERKHYAHGLCSRCYTAKRREFIGICSSCNKEKPIINKEKWLCDNCYRKSLPAKKCKKCGEIRPIKGKGLCVSCATTENIKTLSPRICIECKRADRKIKKGLCKKCYKHEWNQKNMKHILEYSKKWNEEHPERRKATCHRYDTSPKGKITNLLNVHKRNARIKSNGGEGISPKEWEAIKKEHDYRCHYCGEKKKKLEIEHKTPISRGGKHERDNIVPSCLLCNRKKGTMTEEEFLNQNP